MFHVHLKSMCILLLWDEGLYIYQLSPFHLGHFQCHNVFVDILFGNLSIFDSGVLKSPSIFVLLSISFLKSSKIFFMYLGAPMLGACMCTILCLLDGFFP